MRVLNGSDKVASAVRIGKGMDSSVVDDSLKALTDLDSKRPRFAQSQIFLGPRLTLLVSVNKLGEARSFAEKTLTKALEVDDGELLGELAGVLMHPGARKDKSLVTLAVKAAESSSQLAGNNDRFALMKLAEAYYAAGDKTKGKQIGQRAVDATIDERQKESFRRALEYLDKYN